MAADAVLLVSDRKASRQELELLADRLLASSRFTPILVVDSGRSGPVPDKPSYQIVDVAGRTRPSGETLAARALTGLCYKVSPGLLGPAWQAWRRIARGARLAEEHFERFRPSVTVVTDDRGLAVQAGYVSAARRRGIPSLTVPFALSDPHADALARRSRVEYDPNSPPARRLKRWFARRYPENVAQSTAGPRFFFSIGEAAALRAHGLICRSPWVAGAGFTDWAAAIDERSRAEIVDAHGDPARVWTTGMPSFDLVLQTPTRRAEIREKLARRYGLAQEGPFVVCAFPILTEAWAHVGEREKAVLRDLPRALAEAAPGKVLISLHPRADRTVYEPWFPPPDFAILEEPVREVLAAADCFLANSSTLYWASMLDVPSVFLDLFGTGYDLSRNMDRVSRVESLDVLPDAVSACLRSLPGRSGGTADVRGGTRIVELLSAIVDHA